MQLTEEDGQIALEVGGVAHIEAEAEIGIAMGFIGCLSRLGEEL